MYELLPEQNRMNFFVYIIESPSPVDIYHQRYEGLLIQQAVGLNQVGCVHRLAINTEAFVASLQVGLEEAMNRFSPAVPILHISAHGSTEGISLSSGEFISWIALRELLIPINNKLNHNLIVCMSSCEGYSGCRMAMHIESSEYPFYAVIGNSQKPTWPETAIGFATLYHLIKKGVAVLTAVEAMRIASGNMYFFGEKAENSKQQYAEYLKLKAIEEGQGQREIPRTQVEDQTDPQKHKYAE